MKVHLKRVAEPYCFEAENESGAITTIDASESVGGKNTGLRPMELVLAGLGGCAAIDILAILKKKRIDLSSFSIDLFAERKDVVPAAFESAHLVINISDQIDKNQVEKITQLVLDKYCSVSDSLSKEIKITFEINLQ